MGSEKYTGIGLLSRLCDLFGPSGLEGEVSGFIRDQLGDEAGVEISSDRTGNLYAVLRGGGGAYNAEAPKRILISAHMDEVGFMITDIDSEGYLKFCCVGGIDSRVLCGRRVVIGDENNRLPGVIASKAIHNQSDAERKTPTPIDKMYIDIGASRRDEAEEYLRIGDYGTFAPGFCEFGREGAFIKSKALDNRFGCAVAVEVLRSLCRARDTLPFDVCFAFTVREEVGLSGALVAANRIRPDAAIILETTTIADLPNVPESGRVGRLGDGPVLSFADRSTIYDRGLLELALGTAKEMAIPCQLKKIIAGGNDAGHIHKSSAGVRCLAVSAPTRYLHSASCVICKKDYSSTVELVCALLRAIKL